MVYPWMLMNWNIYIVQTTNQYKHGESTQDMHQQCYNEYLKISYSFFFFLGDFLNIFKLFLMCL
jgi:hypothetical protein